MVEIVDRDDIEAQVQTFIETEFAKAQRTLLEEIRRRGLTPETIASLPADIFTLIAPNFEAGIQEQLENSYLLGIQTFTDATTFVPTRDQQLAAQAWASQQAAALTRQLSQTTMTMLQREMQRFFDSGGQTNADLMRSLERLFTPARASMIAITEVTRAASAAHRAITDDLRGQGVVLIDKWQTLFDERVCFICGPRHEQPRGSNWFLDPPAHPRCRCYITSEVVLPDEGA